MGLEDVGGIESKVSYRAVSETNSAVPPRRFGGYAALVAAGILLSRVAGVIRTSVFAHYLGASGAADAFNVALKVPNFLQNLLGEGVLSAAFIPVYSRLVSRGEQRAADRVAGVFVSFLALLVAVIVVIGVIAAPVILRITAAGLDPEVMRMAVRFTRIVFPGVGLLVLYAWALGVLNTHRQFFIGYVAPVLWSASMIATLVIFGMWLSGAALANALAWGTLVGCVLQFGIEVPFVLRHARFLSFGFERSLEPVRTIFRNIAPVVGGRGVVQISGYVDTFIASLLPTGAVSLLFYAQTVYMLPISVFGMSVAAAELPEMSAERGSEDEVNRALRSRLDRGIRQVAFFVVPTTVAFVLIGRVLVAALFQHGGEFTAQTTIVVWYTLIGSSLGLLVSTMSRLYSSAFYALHDTKTPFRIAIARVFFGGALALHFVFTVGWIFPSAIASLGLPLPPMPDGSLSLGVVGITTASAVAAWVEFLLLRRALRRRVGPGASKLVFMIKLWASALTGGIIAVLTHLYAARPIAVRLPLSSIAEAILVSLAFGIVYFGVALALGVPEVRATLGRFRRR
jgi:putative peptidoglycan lipid II flippase